MLELHKIGKRFGAITALQDISLNISPGEVHVLFGENGAGKSTLINIIAGTIKPDGGERLFNKIDISKLNVLEIRDLGIVPVFQEFSLIPSMNVVENLFLGREISGALGFKKKAAMRKKAAEVFERLGFTININSLVEDLSRAEQQMVEIAKALLDEPSILILDEPTASLTDSEAEKLFSVVEDLKAKGVGIVYVSHRMPEIRRLADTITILRNGNLVETLHAKDAPDELLIELMTGEKSFERFPEINHKPNNVMLEVKGLSTKNGLVQNASLEVRSGEVVGIAGLVGSGKSDLIRACFGLTQISDGFVNLYGKKITKFSPRNMLQKGLCYFPSDRNLEGLALIRPIKENVSIAALDETSISNSVGHLRLKKERNKTGQVLSKLAVKMKDQNAHVDTLSGGNRQKVLLARGLMRDINVYLFDEPTVGIDVGAKYEVYELIKHLIQTGAAVILVSSELSEIVNLSNRVYVMNEGVINARVSFENLSEETLLPHFFKNKDKNEAMEVI